MKWLKSRIELLKNDADLLEICLWHIALLALHFYEFYRYGTHYFWYLRAGGCGLIALSIFFFGRKGMAYALLIFSCTLVYVNNFYNYATILFMLIAIGANPKIKKIAPKVYFINVVISFSLKNISLVGFLIHIIYTRLFKKKINYVFKINTPDKLNLTDDERKILDELLAGKMQKEIDFFSQQTITAKLKSARERNMVETTPELISLYAAEVGIKLKIGKSGKPCKPNCPKRDECCMKE